MYTFTLAFRLVAQTLKDKRLFWLSLGPGLLTLLSLIPLEYWFWGYLRVEREWHFIWSLLALVLAGLAAWLFLGNVFVIPFIDPLLNRVQELEKGEIFLPAAPLSFKRVLREALAALFPAFLMVLALPLGFVPVVGLVLSIVLSAYALAFNALAPLFDRAEVPLGQRFTKSIRLLWGFLTYGLGLWLLLLIPVVNVLLLGVAQASAMRFWLHYEHKLQPSKEGGSD